MTRLGVVTGLHFETRLIEKILARDRRALPALACAGASSERARQVAADLIAGGAETLVSFGLCAGLDPGLRPGDLVLAEQVIQDPERRLPVDHGRRKALRKRLESVGLIPLGGALLGSARPIASARDKGLLYETSGARSVDMESLGVALAAESAGAPFLVVRAVADPVERDLPRAALTASGADGRLRVPTTIAALCLRPWEIPMILALAREARLGLMTLKRVVGLPGGLFGGH